MPEGGRAQPPLRPPSRRVACLNGWVRCPFNRVIPLQLRQDCVRLETDEQGQECRRRCAPQWARCFKTSAIWITSCWAAITTTVLPKAPLNFREDRISGGANVRRVPATARSLL
jgi:hypothetical protein